MDGVVDGCGGGVSVDSLSGSKDMGRELCLAGVMGNSYLV